MPRSTSKKDPIVDNPSVDPIVPPVESDTPDTVVEAAPEAAPVDPKSATQVIIAETVIVQGGRQMVERKQDPPKTVTKLPCGTLKQDW